MTKYEVRKIMSTDTKMSYDLLGALVMLKASLGVAIEKMENEGAYSELRAVCGLMVSDVEDVLKTDWHWG